MIQVAAHFNGVPAFYPGEVVSKRQAITDDESYPIRTAEIRDGRQGR
jgi:hypothetical protein